MSAATKGGTSGGKPTEAQSNVNRVLILIFIVFALILAGIATASGLGLV